MAGQAELLVGLDVGASKAAVVVAKRTDDELSVIGSGYAPLVSAGQVSLSEGVRRNAVIDLDATTQAIAEALREAELSANCSIHSALVALGGAHVRGVNSHGVIPIPGGEVRPEHVERVLEAARSIAFPPDRQVLHVLPQDYVLDDQEGIVDPVGMLGVRLEARVHVVTGSVTAVQNVARCCERAGVEPVEVVWAPLAAAEAILTSAEKELGVAFWDFGAGTTDVLVFHRGALRFSFSLGLGGSCITSDVAHGVQTPLREAELIKVRHGCALRSAVGEHTTVEVPGIGGRPSRFIPREEVAWMIEARAEEIVRLVWDEVRRVDADRHVRCGSVIAGGGALLPALDRLVQDVTGMDVRLGATGRSELGNSETVADGRAMLDPLCATAFGLLLMHTRVQQRPPYGPSRVPGLWQRFFEKVREFGRALRE